jgi:hypothetical protein
MTPTCSKQLDHSSQLWELNRAGDRRAKTHIRKTQFAESS